MDEYIAIELSEQMTGLSVVQGCGGELWEEYHAETCQYCVLGEWIRLRKLLFLVHTAAKFLNWSARKETDTLSQYRRTEL
jgi:hypothetical protein